MKEYFISEINIEKLYHLSNITIELDTTKRQHLLLTGKNGSGKTSLLLRLVRYLKVLKDGHLIRLTRTWPELEEDAKRKMEHASSENERFKAEQDYRQWSDLIRKYSDGIRVAWNDNDGLESAYQKGEFITAYFPAELPGLRLYRTRHRRPYPSASPRRSRWYWRWCSSRWCGRSSRPPARWTGTR